MSAGSAIIHHRVTPKIAQVNLGAAVDPLFFNLGLDGVEGRAVCLLRVIATAQHQHTDAFFLRAKGWGCLSDLQAQQHILQGWRQVADLQLVIVDRFATKFGGNGIGSTTAAHCPGRLTEFRRALLRVGLAQFLGEGNGNLAQ